MSAEEPIIECINEGREFVFIDSTAAAFMRLSYYLILVGLSIVKSIPFLGEVSK